MGENLELPLLAFFHTPQKKKLEPSLDMFVYSLTLLQMQVSTHFKTKKLGEKSDHISFNWYSNST